MGQCKATVSGTVINESGNSVPGASVTVVDEIGDRGLRKTFVHHDTARDGTFNFSIDLVGPGKVWLYAKKEDDGYPNAIIALYNERDDPPITLDCGDYRSGVLIKVGPKVGYIGTITVADATTGKPIDRASITIRRVVPKLPRLASVDNYIKTNTSYSNIAIPSNVDISYELSAPGYVTSARKTVNVRPLGKVNISERLRPSSSASPQPK
jgi:hypothetical protein